MPDIVHDFTINASPETVFAAVSTPSGLDAWWSKSSSGDAKVGNTYELDFGPGSLWKALVRRCSPGSEIEYELTNSVDDWLGTRVGLLVGETKDGTHVRFRHSGWREESAHFRTSCFCWAMYLRLLKRYAENGEVVPYGERQDA